MLQIPEVALSSYTSPSRCVASQGWLQCIPLAFCAFLSANLYTFIGDLVIVFSIELSSFKAENLFFPCFCFECTPLPPVSGIVISHDPNEDPLGSS